MGAKDMQWIVVGGSYPGALSAWFHDKYPHLSVMSWSSSGVIKPIQDFYMFDEQIYLSTNNVNTACPGYVQEFTSQMEKSLSKHKA